MSSETQSGRTLGQHFRSHGAHVQRIESGMTGQGIPDANVCLPGGVELWLEGKYLKALPKREKTLVRFGEKNDKRLVMQANWLRQRQRTGGNCFLWIRVEGGYWYLVDRDFHILHRGIPKFWFIELPHFENAKQLVESIVARFRSQTIC